MGHCQAMPSGDKYVTDGQPDVSNVRKIFFNFILFLNLKHCISFAKLFFKKSFQVRWRICKEFMTDTNKSRQMEKKKSNSRETKNYKKQENIIRFHFLAH